jgi:hypothetical protein
MVSVRPPPSVPETERKLIGEATGLLTVTVALLALLARLGSEVVLATVAVFAMTLPSGVAAFTATTKSMLAAAPAARLAMVQFTAPVPPTPGVPHVHPAGAEADWNVVLAGTVSGISTDDAVDGPLLATVIL